MIIIDGVALSKKLQERIHPLVDGRSLLVILPPGTEGTAYMKQKRTVARNLGVLLEEILVETPETALKVLQERQRHVDGVLVQYPLPDMSWQKVVEGIDPEKDIDILGPIARFRILQGTSNFTPPIMRAVDEILASQQVDSRHRSWLVIGGGALVGQPITLSLLSRKYSFAVLEKYHPKPDHLISHADIIICGTGTPKAIDLSKASPAAIVIDAGTSMTTSGISGDVDPQTIQHVSAFSPVPGGLGPITVACLYWNLAPSDT